jgi:hypothetical protein
MKQNFIKVSSFLGVFLLTTTSALAQTSGGFAMVPYGTPPLPVVNPEPVNAVTPPVEKTYHVEHYAVKTPSGVQGFGTNIPLNIAIKQIVPSNVSVTYSPDVDQSSKISWNSGLSWNSTLRSSLKNVGLVSVENGSSLLITKPIIKAPKIIVEAPKTIVTTVTKETVKTVDKAPCVTNKSVIVATNSYRIHRPEKHYDHTIVVIETPDSWHVKAGDTLAITLQKWAALAGWKVSYPIEYIYPMQVSTDFEGSFTDAAGSLINSVQANPLPYICLHTSTKIAEVSLSPDCSIQPTGAQ